MCGQWHLEELIAEGDVPYEQELSRDPQNVDLWLKYYATKEDSTLQQKVFVLERAVDELPKSEQLWLAYVDLLVAHTADLNYYHHRVQLQRIGSVFDRAVSLLHSSLPLWTRYLSFLMTKQYCQVSQVRQKFNLALYNTPVSSHAEIWPIYLEFASLVGGITASRIYQKYIQFEGDAADLEQYVQKFIELGDLRHALVVYQKLVTVNRTKSTSVVNIWKNYLELLLSDEFAHQLVAELFESICNSAIAQWPDQLTYFTLKLVSYYKLVNNHAKVRHLYDNSIRQCTNTHDFVELFNSYTEYEEEQLLNIKDDAELDFRMSIFENLLAQRPLLLNEMLIRQDPNNLDHWFSKVELLSSRLDKKLHAYTMAINQVNPFKAHSSQSKSLVDLWTQYADEYASRNDFNTANIIYSKATTSQFKSLDQLAELYIKWSEFTLSADGLEDPDSQAVQIVEDVLLANEMGDVDVNDTAIDIHKRIHRSPKLWAFYLDLLDSFVEEESQRNEINRVCAAYDKLIELKLATPQNFITYASFLQRVSHFEKSLSVYENGLSIFKDSFIRFEIWNVYLSKAIKYKVSTERVRDLFEQCLYGPPACPAHLIFPVVILYFKFEMDNGLWTKAIKIIKTAISHMIKSWNESQDHRIKISQDKFSLDQLLVEQVSHANDTTLVRELFQFILQDNQLTMPQLNEMAFKFIDFEVTHAQYTRVRELFQFVGRASNPKLNDKLWSKWENFELDYGNEVSFKEMLRFKREVSAEYAQEAAANGAAIGAIGFVKASTPTPQPAAEEAETSNPDQIELDM